MIHPVLYAGDNNGVETTIYEAQVKVGQAQVNSRVVGVLRLSIVCFPEVVGRREVIYCLNRDVCGGERFWEE